MAVGVRFRRAAPTVVECHSADAAGACLVQGCLCGTVVGVCAVLVTSAERHINLLHRFKPQVVLEQLMNGRLQRSIAFVLVFSGRLALAARMSQGGYMHAACSMLSMNST